MCVDQVQHDDSRLLELGELLLRDMSTEALPYADPKSKTRRAVNNLNNAVTCLLAADLTL